MAVRLAEGGCTAEPPAVLPWSRRWRTANGDALCIWTHARLRAGTRCKLPVGVPRIDARDTHGGNLQCAQVERAVGALIWEPIFHQETQAQQTKIQPHQNLEVGARINGLPCIVFGAI